MESAEKASKILEKLFTVAIEKIETIIDEELQETHESISKYLESSFPSILKKLGFSSLKCSFLSAQIQSGGIFDPKKPNEKSNLLSDLVYISLKVSVDSSEVCCGRTVIINPTEDVKKAYLYICDIFQSISFTKSTALSLISQKLKSSAKEKNAELFPYFDLNLGYGSKGKVLEDSSKDSAVPGDIYTFTLSLHGYEITDKFSVKHRKISIILFESFFVQEVGPAKCLTEIVREYQDISYSLESENKPEKINLVELEKKGVLRNSRLRHQVNCEQLEKDRKRKERQHELRTEKQEEIKQRFSNFDGDYRRGKVKQVPLTEISSYQSRENFPESAKKTQIFIDTRHETILLPIHGQIVPFHVSTIKNVSKSEEGKIFFLRINFLHPGGATGKDSKYTLPELAFKNSYFIKELTFRSSNPKNLNNSFKTLKELIKKVKTQDIADKSATIDQDKLILIKGKRPTLMDVTIRPNISGKKTQGTLEGHQNGLRFTSTKNDKIDIIYSNIKNAIFQPVENELIVLIHFRLLNAIMIGSKKTADVQFYTEAGILSDDLDMRRRTGMDLDEIQAEERERKYKEKLNKEFKAFIESLISISNESLDFDIPYRELGFFGVPFKSNVLIMPSVNCLVSLIDQPFFVVGLSEIEIAHFERVQFNLKNFDLVLVFKDYSVAPIRICTIPAEYLDPIKDWLNDIDIVYSDSLNPLNWGNVMKEIVKDINGFIESGGWDFLQESEDEVSEDQESIEDDDSEFSGGEDESSEESEFSEEESEAEESEEESESDESGLDWDEHEAIAKKLDQKKNMKASGVKAGGKGVKKNKK